MAYGEDNPVVFSDEFVGGLDYVPKGCDGPR